MLRTCWLVLGCAVAGSRGADAQARRYEYEVKAAYLLNFLNYVEWPPSAKAGTSPSISICVLGGDPFGEVLQETIRGRAIGGRRITATVVDRPVEADRCDVGFIPADANPPPEVWLEALEGRPVLTVGESSDFAKQGGLIAFVVVAGTVRFEVNLPAARAAQFQISSRLIRLATNRHE